MKKIKPSDRVKEEQGGVIELYHFRNNGPKSLFLWSDIWAEILNGWAIWTCKESVGKLVRQGDTSAKAPRQERLAVFEEQQVWLEHGSSAGETGGGGLTSERWRVGAGRLVPLRSCRTCDSEACSEWARKPESRWKVPAKTTWKVLARLGLE